jgi:anti-sigma28 factor (negative regulator of flagellin synthesis)
MKIQATQEFHRVREAALREPEVRTTLVEDARRQVESGEYRPDPRAVARKVLEDLNELPGC